MVDVSFDEKLAEWQSWCAAPWGRLRFVVVRETLRRQAEALLASGAGPLRVLDVGGGDGRDAVPLAQDGHLVTIVDPAPSWLAEARRRAKRAGVGDRVRTLDGSIEDLASTGANYDLVLCHFVLQYRPSGADDLARLGAALRPGGRLSVMAPNPAARLVQRLTREGPEAALDELRSAELPSATFGATARKLPPEDVEAALSGVGLPVVARYGARVANDFLIDDRLKHDPAYFAALERLELALCDREPFIRLAGAWQFVAERPGPGFRR